jgi:predicted MFS family arabinose efflux permease
LWSDVRQRYGVVLERPAARRFTAAAFVGRLPATMLALGLVALLRSRGWAYTGTGTIVAGSGLAGAAASPLIGRLADRFGQRRTTFVALALYTAALSTIIAWPGLPYGGVLTAAALVGASTPLLSVLVRSRWARHLGGSDRLPDAFAWEAALDAIGWIIGPLVISAVIGAIGPARGLGLTLLLSATGSIWFAVLEAVPPARSPVPAAGRPLPPAGTRRLFAVFVLIGVMLGSTDLALVAYGLERSPRLAGVFLTLFAAGGAAGALLAGAAPPETPLRQRLRVTGGLTVLAMVALLLAGPPAVMAFAAVLAGAALTPFMSLAYAAVGRAVGDGPLAEAIGWAVGGVGVGIAAGTAVAGSILDAASRRGVSVFTLAAAAAAAVIVYSRHSSLG